MIFLDTTILVGGIDSSDRLHSDGREVLEALVEGRLSRAVTTDLVLGETLTILKSRGARVNAVVNAITRILASSLVQIVYVDEELFKRALAAFQKFERLSFVDSVTLTVMRSLRILEIYSHDSDFDLKGIVRKERP